MAKRPASPNSSAAGAPKPARRRGFGMRHIAPAAAAASRPAHLAPQIIEKINGYFGYRAVARLHILHAPVSRPQTAPAPAALRDATPAEKDAVRSQTAGVGDDGLRDALQRLGEAVAARRGGR